jgi:hypothetical protein
MILDSWFCIKGMGVAGSGDDTLEGAVAAAATAAAGSGIEVRPGIRHALSLELQLYFDASTAALRRGGSVAADRAALAACESALVGLASDAGLHQLLPHYVQFLADEVSISCGFWVTATHSSVAVLALIDFALYCLCLISGSRLV